MRYAVITRHRDEFAVQRMCRVLEVSPAGYYGARPRPSSWHALIDEVPLAHVRIIHAESGATYGVPRLHRELQAEGLPASPKRVARLMRADGLVARPRTRRRVSTTDSNHADPIAPNRVARAFDVNGVALTRVWVADITHIPTPGRGVVPGDGAGPRLASVRGLGDAGDVRSRGGAERLADGAQGAGPGARVASSLGSRESTQYTSGVYRAQLAAHGMVASMSRKGDCYDNAVAESFFSTLEFELLRKHEWQTRDDARRAIFQYIEVWYNRTRRHSTLGYLSPMAYEAQLQETA